MEGIVSLRDNSRRRCGEQYGPGGFALSSTNEGLFARAQQVIPGGVNSPVRSFRSVGGTPYFVERAEGAHVYDLFPTVLHLLGLPVPDDGYGKVLTEPLETGAPRSIPSYDFLRERFSVSAGKGSAARNEAELERLRNLGYI